MHPAEIWRRSVWGIASVSPDTLSVIEADNKMSGSRLVVFYAAIGDRRSLQLIVGPARLLPASRTASDDGGTVHLYRETIPTAAAPGVPVLTLCGRHAQSLGIGVDLAVLGVDRDRLCGSVLADRRRLA
jgi:hypothetical protein